MQKNCQQCQSSFEITNDDLTFYDKISPTLGGKKYTIPPPTLCPDCRMQRRQAFRQERMLYRRKCDASEKEVISIYAPEKQFTVFDQNIWWGDSWDGTEQGRDIDFSRPFFAQIAELWRCVPMIALWNFNCENSIYNNNCFGMKDSYMNFNSDYGQNDLYSYVCEFSNDCVDCAFIHKSELCYECIDCAQCFHCLHSRQLENCTDCFFSSDLIGCRNCIGCHGLRHKEHYLFNQKVDPSEWNETLTKIRWTAEGMTKIRQQSEEARLKVPHQSSIHVQCEQVTGDHLRQCRNAFNCFDVTDSEDIKNVIYGPWKLNHVQDIYAGAGAEWTYEHLGGGEGISHCAFIMYPVNGLHDVYYSVLCVNNSHHLFGCVGMKKKEYCILNKQYSREEYEQLAPKIIEHMRRTGEWGEFFPPEISPFAYNETVAQEMYPMDRKNVLARGWQWRNEQDEVPNVQKIIPAASLPPSIDNIPDDILNWAIECEATKRPFQIVKQELAFYRKHGLPIPHVHPDERHRRRMALRNPRRLWTRDCMKCQKDIQTTYAPERPEIVYCESCYLKKVY
jgi:hypothetical protein